MKKEKFLLKILFLLFLFNSSLSNASIENKIIANVDDKIISSYELKTKIKLLLFLSNQELNQETINTTKAMAINSLINYKLKKKELERVNFPLENSKELYEHLKQVSNNFNSDINGLKDIFDNQDLDYEFYFEEMKIQFAWQNFIFKKFQNKINIDENEVKVELKNFIKTQNNIEVYKLAEIEILLTNEKEIKKKIEEIQNQIKIDGFENTAIKFSDSPSSLKGGEIGWVNSKSLSKDILSLIKSMRPGEITKPINQPNSIVLFKLLDRKIEELSDTNIEEIKAQIMNRKANELINLFSNNYLSKLKNSSYIVIK